MEFGYFNGSMFVKLNPKEVRIAKVPLELGDGVLYPGEFLKSIGEKT